MAHKLINLGGQPLEIRLVKRNNATVGLRNDILPDGAVNDVTEFTFKLGANASYEHIVLAHSATANLVNPNDYITNGDLFTLTDGTEPTGRIIQASVRLAEADPNYSTKKIGVFYKVRASDAIYILGDKPNSPAPVTYQVIKGGVATTMSITDIMATKGAYFADDDYYVPLFLGTLNELQSTWLAGTDGVITFTPHWTQGANKVQNEVAIVKIIPATGVTILNTEYSVLSGTDLNIQTAVAPANASIVQYEYSATPPTIATVADSTQPVVSVISSGSFEVNAIVRDELGNQFEASKSFFGILNVEPYSVRLKTTTTSRTASVLLTGAAEGQTMDVNWGDGTVETLSNVIGTPISHTYSANGTFDASFYINGTIASLQHNPTGGQETVLERVLSWGSASVNNFRLTNCQSLVAVPTVAPIGITSLESMFEGCTSFNQNINTWAVNNVTTFKAAFKGATTFNQPLDTWNVSTATNFESMFENTPLFNQALTTWQMGGAVTLKNMFKGSSTFNGDVTGWDVSNVADFSGMFSNARMFNQPLANWNVSTATNMTSMFHGASSFDRPISNWVTSNVTNMSYMFAGDTFANNIFNQDISNWNVSSITNLDGFLAYNNSFSQNLNWWCVDGIVTRPTDFTTTGSPMISTYEPLWGLCPIRESVVTINGLPEYLVVGDTRTLSISVSPEQPVQSTVWSIDNPSVASIDPASGEIVFLTMGTATITVVVNSLYTATQVITVNAAIQPFTFTSTANATVSLDNPTGSEITVDWGDGVRTTTTNLNTTYTFTDGIPHSVKITAPAWDLPSLVVSGGVSEVTSWYGGEQPSIKFGTDTIVTTITQVPALPPTGWNDAEYMFQNCTTFNQDISGWDVSNITSMRGMFKKASAFNQNISPWMVQQVTNMDSMFQGATSFNQDLVLWCVSGIVEAPLDFATGATAFLATNYPVWGTCPNRSLVTTLSVDKTTLGLGLKTRVAYTTDPVITVTEEVWTVDDNTILSVSSRGLVTAKALGSTYVRVTLNKTYKAAIRITATETSFAAETMVLELSPTDTEALYIANEGGVTSFEVDYGDGNTELYVPGTRLSHSYTDPGQYYVQITPVDGPISISLGQFYNRVLQWTSVGYERLVLSDFNQPAYALVDVPTTEPTGLTTYRSMFAGAVKFNDDLSGWNTSAITDMAHMFRSAYLFNGNITTWNTANVTDMQKMFNSAKAFNQNISGWDVSSVGNMSYMFDDATVFNVDITSWNVSNVASMDSMFNNAAAFNQDLRWWCVSLIEALPYNFATGTTLLTSDKYPVWGTCPSRNYGLIINNPGDVDVDQTATLTYNLTPETVVVSEVWTSSDVGIATVSAEGVVTGVAEGSVTISLVVNTVYTATVTFNITPGVVITAPTNLTFVNIESPYDLTAEVIVTP